MILEYIEIYSSHSKTLLQMLMDVLECNVDLQNSTAVIENMTIQFVDKDIKLETTSHMVLNFMIDDRIADNFHRKFELFSLKRKVAKDKFILVERGSSYQILDPEGRWWKFVGRSDLNLI